MGNIISFSHQKGGVGKSTLAYNVAKLIDKHDLRVCVVDMDKQGSLAKFAEVMRFDVYSDLSVSDIEELPHDIVIVDTPPYLADNLVELYQASSCIVIPSKAGIFDILALDSTLDLVKEAEATNKVIAVMNMVKPNTTLTKEVLDELKKKKVNIAKTQISDLVSFTRSVYKNGLGDDRKAEQQLEDLTNEIIHLIK